MLGDGAPQPRCQNPANRTPKGGPSPVGKRNPYGEFPPKIGKNPQQCKLWGQTLTRHGSRRPKMEKFDSQKRGFLFLFSPSCQFWGKPKNPLWDKHCPVPGDPPWGGQDHTPSQRMVIPRGGEGCSASIFPQMRQRGAEPRHPDANPSNPALTGCPLANRGFFGGSTDYFKIIVKKKSNTAPILCTMNPPFIPPRRPGPLVGPPRAPGKWGCPPPGPPTKK